VKPHHAAVEWNVLAANANVATPNFAVFDEPGDYLFRSVDSDCEANALGGQNDRGVDADYFSSGIDQRPAGIAGVQSGVGLDNIVDKPASVCPKRTPKRADHAGGNGALESVRIADRDGELSDANALGFAKAYGLQLRRKNPDHGQVSVGIIAGQMRVGPTPIRERDLDFIRTVNHVTVGQNKPVRGDYEPRSAALAFPILFSNFDINDGGSDLVGGMDYGFGIGIE